MTTLNSKKNNDNNKKKELTQDTSTPFPFLQYSFGQRLKTSLPPPFSKLFFTSNIKYNMLEQQQQQHKIPNDPFQVIHDPELCMFLIKLDSKGSTGKKKNQG